MADTCETVLVERKDHPDGAVRINKEDMQEGDKIVEPKPEKKEKKKKDDDTSDE